MILVTGGAGYIGAHTCVELLKAGREVVVFDNFSNSYPESLQRVKQITGQSVRLEEGDVRDAAALRALFAKHKIDAVIHFAGLKAVGESVEKPLAYYDNNVTGSLRLLEAMDAAGVTNFVFSSSATVYGEPKFLPFTEEHPLAPTNPYGRTKFFVEEILRDVTRANPAWRVALLRYFNPVGAHESGLIGEDPRGIPNNLLPYVAQVASGRLPFIRVFGDDYPTADGTGVRDYLHVVDLALGHVKAIDYLEKNSGLLTTNLGTGKGSSVLEVIHAFEKACGQTLAHQMMPRRAGDVAAFWADPTFAEKTLSWQAVRGLDAMCADAWRWQSQNPNGLAPEKGA